MKVSNPTPRSRRFEPAPDLNDLARMDLEVLNYWDQDRTFEASIQRRFGAPEFTFYDGPPFANGLPHYGHFVTGYAKDIIPRFQTMRGMRVERRFGWDTHGLPAELAAEKATGVSGRKEILELGIGKFNAAARAEVLRYVNIWKDYVKRSARWVDFDGGYKTLDLDFMESCMWAFKQLWELGLVYRDYRVVPYSWAVESSLSHFETRLDDAYRTRRDPALTVKLEVTSGKWSGAHLLIWTTTPWTLPCNLAVAANADIEYVAINCQNDIFILSSNALSRYADELEGGHVLERFNGARLLGTRYNPPFNYFKHHLNAFKILCSDAVSDTEGTGLVHLAPGFGELDLEVCRAADIEIEVPVDHAGRFTSDVPDYHGVVVFDANKPIIQKLREENRILRQEEISHSYPHCWRTDKPLIYRATESWYIKVSQFRDQMVSLNEEIRWIPEHVKEGIFGHWLANAQDWNISRTRFWGTPIPIWTSDDPDFPRIDVYGSISELERDFKCTISDLHRPFIDVLTRPNPDDPSGRSTMRRIEDVFDVWFDSGCMPFAAVHYPFENKDWFEQHFPADFIVEYVAQTRGWFYTLMGLSVMLFNKAPFKNAICHGVVLDATRKKLSKRLKNYPDPLSFLEFHSSDTMRWFLVSSPVLAGGDLLIPRTEKEIAAAQKEVIGPLVNAYSFFALYANLEERAPKEVRCAGNSLDEFILAKTGQLIRDIESRLDRLTIPDACKVAIDFCDDLTNWYIRRARARFWGSSGESSKHEALDTLYTVLKVTFQVLAPLLPILCEKLYRALTSERSVHLTEWPSDASLPLAPELIRGTELARGACSAVRSVRERYRLRVRLPLKQVTIVHPNASLLKEFQSAISDETNTHRIAFATETGAFGKTVLSVDPRIGRRIGARVKELQDAAAAGRYHLNENGTINIIGITIGADEYFFRLCDTDGKAFERFGDVGVVVVDVSVDHQQEIEGISRDLVRAIQSARKAASLEVNDRISLLVEGGPLVSEAIEKHQKYIMDEVLASKWGVSAEPQIVETIIHHERIIISLAPLDHEK